MTLVVLVRHGESEWNAERRIQGQDGTGLTALGKAQAVHTARFVARRHEDALLASSDLQRCRETSAPFSAEYGVEPRYEPGLRERAFGTWTGRLADDVAGEDGERWERWRCGEDVIGEVGGENTPTLSARVVETIRSLAAVAAGRSLVCVTHGGPVWHGTRALLGLGPGVLGRVDNCSVTEVAVDFPTPVGRLTRLVSWNQIAHLPADLQRVLPEPAPDIEDEEPPDE